MSKLVNQYEKKYKIILEANNWSMRLLGNIYKNKIYSDISFNKVKKFVITLIKLRAL